MNRSSAAGVRAATPDGGASLSRNHPKLGPTSAPCDDQPGRVIPIVDPNRCENKGPCVEVCPYDVFEIRPLAPLEWKRLGLIARFKVRVHGGKQAFVVRPEACHACGLCVTACPENAIKLRRRPDPEPAG